MNTLFCIGSFEVTVFMTGTALSVLIGLAVALIARGRKVCGMAGGIGIALFPMIALIRVFEQGTPGSVGAAARSEWVRNSWFGAADGTVAINRIEAVSALLLFLILIVWLLIRRRNVRPDADLLLVSLALLGAERTALGPFHEAGFLVCGTARYEVLGGLALMLICLLIWLIRLKGHPLLKVMSLIVFACGAGVWMLKQFTRLSTGTELYDTIILYAGLLLALKASLTNGREDRKAYGKE